MRKQKCRIFVKKCTFRFEDYSYNVFHSTFKIGFSLSLSSQTLITTRIKLENKDSLIIRQPSRANQQVAKLILRLILNGTIPV
jgi:hypothetical protein